MTDDWPSQAADEVRRTAREGRLAEVFHKADTDRRRRLRAGAAEIVTQPLFMRLTRGIELRRGHRRCAAGWRHLEHECLENFHNDLDAVLDHLFERADEPIENLEGWITSRLTVATVDGYRRRRGAIGAAQRPRVPIWLADALDGNAWRIELAKEMMEWAGNSATAGTSRWPLSAWAAIRADRTGDHTAGESVVAEDVEIVLAAMDRRPAWRAKNIDDPLDKKPAPGWLPSRDADGDYPEPEPMTMPVDERVEALLHQLAADAMELMTARVEQGEDPAVVAADVLPLVFDSLPVSYGSDQPPGGSEEGPEQAMALIEDPDRRAVILGAVIMLLSEVKD